MKTLTFLMIAGVAFAAAPLSAQVRDLDDTQVAVSPGKALYTTKVRSEATVKKIDYKTRKFTLVTADGETAPMTAGPEIKNFNKVKVGDKVIANYEESIELTLVKGGKEPIGRREMNADELAAAGAVPGAKAISKTVIVANVTKVDKKKGVVTLQGATDAMDLKIKDPKQLGLVKVGDQVRAMATTSLALSLEPAKK
jgi:Cu/Ag efflux protein CusF